MKPGSRTYADRGVPIDAYLTRQILINIFYPNSPASMMPPSLSAGIGIVAASVVLPLTDNVSAEGQLGTRHRAAIGVTEDSDALAVIVSEETGQISVAHNGRLIRNSTRTGFAVCSDRFSASTGRNRAEPALMDAGRSASAPPASPGETDDKKQGARTPGQTV